MTAGLIQDVAPAALDCSLGRLRLLPERLVQEKVESLRTKGQLSPMIAAAHEGALVLVDGFLRRAAALRLMLPTVRVEVLSLSPVQMKVQMVLRNRDRRLLLLEECRLVRELAELDGLAQVEIGDLLERHKSWVCRRLSLARQLSANLWEEWSLGAVGEGSLRKLAQLPARNQEELWAVCRREGLTDRESASLVDLWRKAPDPEARKWVMAHPQDAIRRAQGGVPTMTDARLGLAGVELLRDLECLRHAALRVLRRIRGGLGDPSPEGVRILADARASASTECGRALEPVRAWAAERGAP